MTNERVIELVNGELDGTNTAAESVELAGILQGDDVARAFFDETKVLFGALGQVPDVEPPADLKDRIMESVHRQAAAMPTAEHGFASSLKNIFKPIVARPTWAISYAFVAGLLVGVAGWMLVANPAGPENGVVQGTMVQPSLGVLDEATLQVGGITVDLATVGLDNEVVLDVTISGSGDSTVQIQTTDEANRGTSIIASGPGHFTVSLDRIDDLVVTVTSSGQQGSVRLLTSPS